jgi:hypothetical protein
MRRALAGVAAGLATFTLGAPAFADTPPGLLKQEPDVFVCNGEVTEIFGGNGRTGWVDGVLYMAQSFSLEGTVTAPDGSVEPISESKTWGNGPKRSGPAVTCTAHFEVEENGFVFEADFTVTAVPVR